MGLGLRLRSFRFLALVRVTALVATVGLLVILAHEGGYPLTTALVAAVALLEVYGLLRFVETSNRRLVSLLEAISHSDFTSSFATGLKGRTFTDLDAAFAEVIGRFRQVRLEREESARFLEAVLQHVGTGLIVLREDGSCELVNAAARRILGAARVPDLGALAELCPALTSRLAGNEPCFEEVIPHETATGLAHLLVHSSALRLRQRRLTLVAFHNISNELEEREMEAWQNLVRVFTHEIKNSLTPIASLSSTVQDLLAAATVEPPATSEDTNEALETIRLRSQGLLEFVNAYRELTRLPVPEIEIVPVAELCSRVEALLAAQLGENDLSLETRIDPAELQVSADPRLLEQVLLNLVLNAIQALDGRPDGRIRLHARREQRERGGRTVIEVIDNGPGITREALDKVFVPFFSTKSGGTGIGLSLSRQIMRLHRGDLLVRTEPDVETVFSLRLR